MDNTIIALQNLYIALGGELTDTYENICNGEPVSNYVIIPDMVNALAEQVTANKATSEDDGE